MAEEPAPFCMQKTQNMYLHCGERRDERGPSR